MKQIKFAIALLMAIAMLLSLAACGDKGPDVTGKYICVGESYYDAPLEEPYQESWLELKKGGKGIYYSGFEFNIKWKLDGEAFSATVSFLGMEDTMEGTLKDGVIDVKYGDMTIRFVKEGVEVPAGSELAGGSSGVNAPGGTGVTGANDGVLVAGSLADAFSGASAGVPGGSETAVIENPSTWYGWLALTDFWGIDQEEDIYDAWAYVNMDSTGKPYFEVFQDGDSENPFLSMYMTIEENGTCIMPDIGTEDAWTVDTYLNAEDAENYQTFLNEDGSLMLSYDYTRYDGAYGCSVTMFFREDGAQWDEENDLLPPRYDEYKAALEQGDSDNGADPQSTSEGDYGKSNAAADGIVDFDTLKAGFTWLKYQTSYENGYARPTYEEIAQQLGGTDGKKTHESSWKQDYHVYEWVTAGGDFLLLSFKVQEDGSETWNSSSWSSSLND
ncbi:MAG: hypothetical protein MRZ67_10650 [Christensenella sp.]|jgi:hypothetical protein|nr:hypothetical protein [Christensenella sp.]